MSHGKIQAELERREGRWRESLLRRYDLEALTAFIRQIVAETKPLDGVDLGRAMSSRWSIGGHSMLNGDWYFTTEPDTDDFVLRTTLVREKTRGEFPVCPRRQGQIQGRCRRGGGGAGNPRPDHPQRAAAGSLGSILPPGFRITGLRQIEGPGEVVSIVEWKSTKVSGSQLAVLFKFTGDKTQEERWFSATAQWRGAF